MNTVNTRRTHRGETGRRIQLTAELCRHTAIDKYAVILMTHVPNHQPVNSPLLNLGQKFRTNQCSGSVLSRREIQTRNCSHSIQSALQVLCCTVGGEDEEEAQAKNMNICGMFLRWTRLQSRSIIYRHDQWIHLFAPDRRHNRSIH